MRFLKVFLVIFSVFGGMNAAKAGVFDSLVLETGISFEYSGVDISGNGVNSDFGNKPLEMQLRDFENVALGLHFRVHKYFGINVNWAQTDMSNASGLDGIALSSVSDPQLRLDYTNYSALFFLPFVEDSVLEGFLELGVSDMYENLTYVNAAGAIIGIKDHQSNPFVGFGINYLPFEDSLDSVRFSVQRYTNKINVLGSDFTTFRAGYIVFF